MHNLTPPAAIRPQYYRLYVVIQYVAMVGLLGHFLFLIQFWILGVVDMARVNIISCLVFAGCFLLNRRGLHSLAMFLGILEVVIHAILAVLYTGWGSGFYYYLLCLVHLIYYAPTWKISFKMVLSAVLCSLYLMLYLYMLNHPPIAGLAPGQQTWVMIINVIVTFLVFSALAYYYWVATTDAEKKLRNTNQVLDALARTDVLTQLTNRRRMQEIIEQEVRNCIFDHEPLTFILGDLDHFKRINDEFGHACGDQVLVEVSRVMKRVVRKGDYAARWGGEEFLFLLPQTDVQVGEKVAERLRSEIESLAVEYEGQSIHVTMTFGVGAYDGSKTSTLVLSQADQALYQGKDAGRNCVVVATER
jgi:diguanylate cyclase (GGDEF)-like protein